MRIGNVYFIRHGESTRNERNIFAGVLDVDLTSFCWSGNTGSDAFSLCPLGLSRNFGVTNLLLNSNHHSNNWKFIGVLAVALMALATGFQFTPSTFLSDLFFSTDPNRSLACLQQLAVATLVFLSMRLLAVLTSVGRLFLLELM